MKSILVPIDFSQCSVSAAHFAIEIAKEKKTNLILFHSFHLPLPPPDSDIEPISVSALMETNTNRLNKIADELKKNNRSDTVIIECEVVLGFAVDEIVESAKRHKVTMIVMGTQGASGLKKYVFGSNTASVINKSQFPVLVVPDKAIFSNFKKIAFAVDLHAIKDNFTLQPLVDLALLFSSEIKLFSVKDNFEEPISMEQAIEKLNLDKVLKSVPHTFHLAKDKNIIHAIDVFLKDSRADLLAILPQKHNQFDLLLNKSVTRDLAFHIKIPLLTLPEYSK